ncbi:MAG: hypothetical protein HY909_20830 [Deltaproteobacteria bacterium]|nr:hypothetical protein [Deltaproteobacteria bacterium]
MRRPHAAGASLTIPSLTTWLAGALFAGCQDPQCATDRAGELSRHGEGARQDLHRGAPGRALREVGLATGVLRHPPPAPLTLPSPQVPLPEENLLADGEMMTVTPQPPEFPHAQPPPRPAPPPRVRQAPRPRVPPPPPVRPRPREHEVLQGDVVSVGVAPADPSRLRG